MSIGPVLITFKLNIKNSVQEFPVETYTFGTLGGTLFQAMQDLQSKNPGFSFETKHVPSSGKYVVAVQGIRNGPGMFWETLLYNESSKEVKPINLDYQVCMGDEVYLKYSHL